MAKELGPRHIRVNSINPGMVETEGTHAAGITDSDFRKRTESQTPLNRITLPTGRTNLWAGEDLQLRLLLLAKVAPKTVDL